MSRALRWHAWWVGTDATPADVDASVVLHDEFLAPRLSADELRAAMEARMKGEISKETFYHALKQGGPAHATHG